MIAGINPLARSMRVACLLLLLACALLLLAIPRLSLADVFRPAYLELRETGQGRYDVLWKVPAQGDMRLAVDVSFPPDTVQELPPQGRFVSGAYVERWRISRPGGLADQSIHIDGIASGVTDVIVRVERQDGTSQVERLLPANPQFVVEAPTGTAAVAWSYLVLGVEHILGGVDHLLFVLALLLIVRGTKRIFFTITAFTIAHSITLIAATLGWVHVPGPPVEAMIALSIVFVAAEIVHGFRGKPGLTARAPWVVAFSFGLLHGFGFAGALAEVGLPQKAIPVALLMFNVGVEVGQLIFVAAALAAGALLSQLRLSRPDRLQWVTSYAIGAVAMFWVIERIAAFG
jgi:hydrogenase/urease accessory protein HupE